MDLVNVCYVVYLSGHCFSLYNLQKQITIQINSNSNYYADKLPFRVLPSPIILFETLSEQSFFWLLDVHLPASNSSLFQMLTPSSKPQNG